MTIKLSEEQKRKLSNSNDVYSIMQEILLRAAAAIKTAREKEREKRNVEIAKAGLKKGLSIEIISGLTGLTEKEIEGLQGK